MEIISFAGKQRSGKDTAGDYLVEKYGYIKISLADELKRIAKDEFGITKDMPNGREFLQQLGTELVRKNIGEDFWVDKLLSVLEEDKKYVVCDVRYPNEADKLRNYGPIMWIETHRNHRAMRGELTGEDHISENALDEYVFNAVLFNNGTKEELYYQIDQFMMSNDNIQKK